MFSPEEYTHFTPKKGAFLISIFVASVFGLCGVVSLYYPDRPSATRTWPDGLEKELGGKGAMLVSFTKASSKNVWLTRWFTGTNAS
jgi:NADH dehydrogenase (ubiquinone) 1 beta subcomplex subunit 8